MLGRQVGVIGRCPRPNLIILDILFHGRDEFNLIAKIRKVHLDGLILVYSVLDEMIYAQRCLQAGAHGYIMKSEPLANVITALETLAHDNFYVSAAVQRNVLAGIARQKIAAQAPLASLSNR